MRIALRIGLGLLAGSSPLVACQLVFPNVVRDEAVDSGGIGGGGQAGAGQAGGGQAGAGPDAGVRWCKTQGAHLFCSDFDGFTVDEGWDNKSTSLAGGKLEQDGAETKSPPFALLCSTPEIFNQSDYPVSGLTKAVQLAPGGVRISFDIRLESIDSTYTAAVWLHSFEMVTSGGVIDLNLIRTAVGTYLSEDRYYATPPTDTHTTYPLAKNLEVGTWTHVTIQVDALDGGAKTTARVFFDTVSVLDPPLPATAYDLTKPLNFSLGLQVRGGPSKLWQVRYDNYTIDSP